MEHHCYDYADIAGEHSTIGNSEGMVIFKPVLAQLGLDAKASADMTIADMTIADAPLLLRRLAGLARKGWARAARSLAELGDDELVMGEFGNVEDSNLAW